MDRPIDPVWGLKLSPDELARLQSPTSSEPVTPTFKPLEAVEPLAADDMECFAEIRAILERHNKLDRFGVVLLHEHFPIKKNEVLLETSDASSRSMTLEPKILDTSDVQAIDTQWYLGKSMPLSLVKCRTSMHIQ